MYYCWCTHSVLEKSVSHFLAIPIPCKKVPLITSGPTYLWILFPYLFSPEISVSHFSDMLILYEKITVLTSRPTYQGILFASLFSPRKVC